MSHPRLHFIERRPVVAGIIGRRRAQGVDVEGMHLVENLHLLRIRHDNFIDRGGAEVLRLPFPAPMA